MSSLVMLFFNEATSDLLIEEESSLDVFCFLSRVFGEGDLLNWLFLLESGAFIVILSLWSGDLCPGYFKVG